MAVRTQMKTAGAVLAGVILSLFLLLNTASAQNPGPVPTNYFGLSSMTPSRWPTVSFGAYKPTQVSWAAIEKSRGVYDWTLLDRTVATAEANNVEIFYTFVNVPQWASSAPTQYCYAGNNGCAAPVSNLVYWDEFVSQVAMRYKGRIAQYELWNEPNDLNFWSGTTAQMVEMSRRAYNLIKGIDPSAAVISPAATWSKTTAWSWLDGFLAAGGGSYVDIVSFHGYTGNAKSESVFTIIDNVKKVMAAHAVTKPLWITEGGWGVNTVVPDPSAQAAFLAQRYLLIWSRGVSRFYWYQWDNSQWGTLWDATSGVHPAGTAYGQVYSWMVGSTMTAPCAQATDYTWTCPLQLANGVSALAIWNNSASVAYTVPSQYASYRDLTGKVTTVPASRSLTVTKQPVLLFANPNQPPKAVLTLNVQTPIAPADVIADSSASSDPDGTIASRSIDFGDGTVVTNAMTPSHTYASPGSYTVSLTVTDNSGATSQASATTTISACSYAGMASKTVKFCAPAAGSTVASTLRVVALAADSASIKVLKLYVDGTVKYQLSWAAKMDTAVSVGTGTHLLKVEATDSVGAVFSNSITVNAQ